MKRKHGAIFRALGRELEIKSSNPEWLDWALTTLHTAVAKEVKTLITETKRKGGIT